MILDMMKCFFMPAVIFYVVTCNADVTVIDAELSQSNKVGNINLRMENISDKDVLISELFNCKGEFIFRNAVFRVFKQVNNEWIVEPYQGLTVESYNNVENTDKFYLLKNKDTTKCVVKLSSVYNLISGFKYKIHLWVLNPSVGHQEEFAIKANDLIFTL